MRADLPKELLEDLESARERFIAHGGVLDRQTRKYVAAYFQDRLIPGTIDMEELNEGYFRHFRDAMDDILQDEVLREVCADHDYLAVQVVKDLMVWFRRNFGEITEGHPYEDEEQVFGSWTVRPMAHVLERFAVFAKAMSNYYTRQEVDPSFHIHKMKELAAKGSWDSLGATDQEEAGRLFDDLLGQWDGRLQAKVLEFQLKRSKEKMDELGESLLGKAREFKQLDELIEPFAGYASRYWDLSRDLWVNSSFDVIEKYRELLDKEDELKRLADLLGKMRVAELITEEEEFQETVIHEGRQNDPNRKEEVIGVFESKDLNSIISSEAALLADQDTESVFLKKYADHGLLTKQYQTQYITYDPSQEKRTYQSTKKKEKGPFIVCVDTSGSMEGDPEQIAKVLCFGIMKMAAAENRRAYLINFSTGVKTLDLLNIADNIDALAHFLKMSFEGGTDISLALHESLEQLQTNQYQDADVLIISDFIMYKLDKEVARRMEFQQMNHNTKFHSLIISDQANDQIIDLFDNVWIYDPKEKGIMQSVRENVSSVLKAED